MTEERQKTAAVVDEAVSDTYREIAQERVPEYLDRAILDKAARAARPRYARSRAWTRPLAWAATIALSVAIVLEVTQVPSPEDAVFERDAPASDDAVADAPAGVAAAPAKEAAPAQEAAPAAIAAPRPTDVLPRTPEKTSLMQKTSPPLAAEADAEQRQSQAAAAEPKSEAAADPRGAAEIDVKDQEFLRRADEMAEMQYTNTREEIGVPEQAARFREEALASATEECPEAVQRDPQDWLECIDGLVEAGFEAEAAEQRRLLREAFPAFEMP
jgi:hypothetical protein